MNLLTEIIIDCVLVFVLPPSREARFHFAGWGPCGGMPPTSGVNNHCGRSRSSPVVTLNLACYSLQCLDHALPHPGLSRSTPRRA